MALRGKGGFPKNYCSCSLFSVESGLAVLDDNDPNATKFALLTAYDPKDCLMPAREAGCDLVLGKPIDVDKFDHLLDLLPQNAQSEFRIADSAHLHSAH